VDVVRCLRVCQFGINLYELFLACLPIAGSQRCEGATSGPVGTFPQHFVARCSCASSLG
jgi:hypothetical protein